MEMTEIQKKVESGEYYKDFKKDIVQFILENYELGGNENVANYVFDKASEEGHSSGYNEVLNEMYDFAHFAEKVYLEAKGGEK